MTREERERTVRRQKILIVVIAAVAAAFIIGFAVTRSKDGSNSAVVQSDEQSTEVSAPAEDTTPEDSAAEPAGQVSGTTLQFTPAEKDDGTGAAGVLSLNDYRAEAALTPGWHSEDAGIWYGLGESFCYYNGWQDIDGQTYHFDALGYATRGWKMIGTQSCYFDDNGVYVPGADNSKLIAFTFDDGPSQGMDQLLELCEQTGARVTFFMIGKQVENGGAVIPHIIRDRCEIGNHSDTHTQALKLTPEESRDNFAACDEKIASFSGGAVSTVIRYPYGDYTAEHLALVGKPAIMWDVDSLDWESEDPEAIKAIVREQISEGDIILMHDRYDATVEACRVLFPELIAQGYQLVTVSELAAAKGYELEPGVAYYNFRNDAIENGSFCTRG